MQYKQLLNVCKKYILKYIDCSEDIITITVSFFY